MKIYKHEGTGHYIGSVIIVQAGSKTTAKKVVRAYLDSVGLEKESTNCKLVPVPTRKSFIIYAQDGDY